MALLVIFALASAAAAIMALFPRSPIRRWCASRQHPRGTVAVSTVSWAIVAAVLLTVTFAAGPPADDAASTAGAPSTSTRAAAPARATSPAIAAVPPTTSIRTDPDTTERTTQHDAVPDGVPRDAQPVQVAHVVDGDTLEAAAVSSGAVLSGTAPVDVRLLEIDAPETKHPSEPEQCYGREATEKLSELAPAGDTVWVQRDEELRDRYGRHLLYVWNAAGVFVNRAMVTQGFAQPDLYEPNDRHWDTINTAGGQARAAAAGLWSACESFGVPADTPPERMTSAPTAPEPEPRTVPTPPRELERPSPRSGPESARDGTVSYPYPPDKDCADIEERDFRVQEGDPHRFDAEGDGIGCDG